MSCQEEACVKTGKFIPGWSASGFHVCAAGERERGIREEVGNQVREGCSEETGYFVPSKKLSCRCDGFAILPTAEFF